MAAAFFDLDHTVVDGNVGLRHVVKYFLRGQISIIEGFRMGFMYIYYVLIRSEPFYFFSRVFGFMKGRDLKEETRRCAQYFEKHFKKRIFKEAVRLIEWHKKQKHLIVIVTNSLDYKITRIKEAVRADYVIASSLETLKGKFTGRSSIINFGQNKARNIRKFAKRFNISLKKSYAYSDNSSDIPMLRAVGNPVAVNPQMRLKRYALHNNWKILRFQETGG